MSQDEGFGVTDGAVYYDEYFAKMEFAMYGYEVYTAEVDDRGIDFVVRGQPGTFYEVQVKTVTDYNLAYINESKFRSDGTFLIALVRLVEAEPPEHYVFRGTDWPDPSGLLVRNLYEGKKSEAAYEVHLATSRMKELQHYRFDDAVARL
ncbi:MAG: hypothetical protein CME26_08570 [Gemmatimonadetes bacterium]|nr:hypothetical protein [Gemmatimonadota bacterium]|tara:strand:+ start:848 stop:1294 length:447 start_codon:yes stop_codon:yes gene_type:complete